MSVGVPPIYCRYGWSQGDTAEERIAFCENSWAMMQAQPWFEEVFLPQMPIFPRREERVTAWDYTRVVNGGADLPNIPQTVGDCVSRGGENVIEALSATEIVRLKQLEEFHQAFAPFLYSISRQAPEGGSGRINGDGSLGSWLAATAVIYGTLWADGEGVPAYETHVIRAWGNRMPERKFLDMAKPHPVRKIVPIRTAEEAVSALTRGYWITIAGMWGASMRLKDDRGKSWFTGRAQWPHQMSFLAYDPDPEPCVYRMNSWGPDAHGPQLDGPNGGGWYLVESLADELEDRGTECYAWSDLAGVEDRTMPDFYPDDIWLSGDWVCRVGHRKR
jgi:hypothetical protein